MLVEKLRIPAKKSRVSNWIEAFIRWFQTRRLVLKDPPPRYHLDKQASQRNTRKAPLRRLSDRRAETKTPPILLLSGLSLMDALKSFFRSETCEVLPLMIVSVSYTLGWPQGKFLGLLLAKTSKNWRKLMQGTSGARRWNFLSKTVEPGCRWRF